MFVTKSYHRMTRRGAVLKVLREHYLRDDIACGSALCEACYGSGSSAAGAATVAHDVDAMDEDAAPAASLRLSSEPRGGRYILLDTNIVLHQMDLLEHAGPALCDVIILQTVASEARARSPAVSSRLAALMRDSTRRFIPFPNEHHRELYSPRAEGESANDYNDRLVRTAAGWFKSHLHALGLSLLFLTDDAASRSIASSDGIPSASAADFFASQPALLELLAAPTSATGVPLPTLAPGALYRDHASPSALADAIKSRAAFAGTLRLGLYSPWEGRVAVHGVGDGVATILVKGREDLNRAMEGDTVVLALHPKSAWKKGGGVEGPPATLADLRQALREAVEVKEKQAASGSRGLAAEEGSGTPTGRVIGILRRAWRHYCGSLEPEPPGALDGGGSAAAVLFVPVDVRIPRIRIRTRQAAALADKRFIVALDAWAASSAFPEGHYVRSLGPIGDKGVETEVILIEHDIPTRPFSADVMACLPPADWAITSENSVGRTDLRGVPVCSVDPPGCKDIDDALHAVTLPSGRIQVGVHIADVSHFVRHGSAIDVEAALRANTTYLVERRLDMLPGLLTETLCSLKSGVDRFAFSVTWEYEAVPVAEGETGRGIVGNDEWRLVPGSVNFFKSMIHSQASLTYAAAQALLDAPVAATPVAAGIKLLASIARWLRRSRIAAGALSLASPEVRFMLDSETHEPLDVQAYELKETNSMVEEFMLLANVAVAARTCEAFPTCAMLRRHPAPRQAQLRRAAGGGGRGGRHAARGLLQGAGGLAGCCRHQHQPVLQQAAAHHGHAVHAAGGVLLLGGGRSARVPPLRPGHGHLHPLHVPHPPLRGRHRASAAGGCPGAGAAAGRIRGQGGHARPERQHEPAAPHGAAGGSRQRCAAHAHILQGARHTGARPRHEAAPARRGDAHTPLWHGGQRHTGATGGGGGTARRAVAGVGAERGGAGAGGQGRGSSAGSYF